MEGGLGEGKGEGEGAGEGVEEVDVLEVQTVLVDGRTLKSG